MFTIQNLSEGAIRQRMRKASRWQDHARLIFEVVHSPTIIEDARTLVQLYKAQMMQNASPLARWGYAYTAIEIYKNDLLDDVRLYVAIFQNYLTQQLVFDELRKVVNQMPNAGMGYLGLALAYESSMLDEQISHHREKVDEVWTTMRRGGKEERVKIPVHHNPEAVRRFHQNVSKLRSLEPNNPYLSHWQVQGIHYHLEIGRMGRYRYVYDAEKLKGLKRQDIAEEGYRLAKKAYEDGFKYFSPVVGLGEIVNFAWLAGRRAEARQWGEQLEPWIAQNPRSPYVERIKQMYSHGCPLIRDVTSR